MKLLAVDPGNTTGWALFNTEDLSLIHSDAQPYTLLEWWELLQAIAPKQMVVERFALYAHKAENQVNSTFLTVEVIGVCRLYSQVVGIPMATQTAQQGKQIWSDGRLKQFDYWQPNKHARDAIRHGLTFMDAHRAPRIRGSW
jgi:hypothetical protein